MPHPPIETEWYRFYNEDCVEGCKHLDADSVDLIITDPPYGINGDKLHKHYNRDESFVLDGYVEVPAEDYAEFSRRWIEQAARILKPGGSIYIVSGYTNLRHILNALADSPLEEVNHIIWKYNFGVHTRYKYVSSHYHILFYVKPGARHTFNTYCRFGANEQNGSGQKKNYADREDVWEIRREYKPGKAKNKNELPYELLKKMLLYSSNEGSGVLDLFMGSFSTAFAALRLKRRVLGFEINSKSFEGLQRKLNAVELDESSLIAPQNSTPRNQGKAWSPHDLRDVKKKYIQYKKQCGTKRQAIDLLCEEYGRGYFSILNVIDKK
ncbi:site-specific DNA-methyltransferase [Candidatus Sumerlaeota bacterium]|nr:site-specific DNA-methyltransferase [Candidatus Sumerlaeota bacterium]